MSELNDDVLVIARWCWPDRSWRAWGRSEQAEVYRESDGLCMAEWWPCDGLGYRESIADAEKILIERGHADRYGREPARALYPDGESWMEGARFAVTTTWHIIGKLATAPLDVRVKALAAVIRSLAEAR